MQSSSHQQQMAQSMSTGNNSLGGASGVDRGGGGSGSGTGTIGGQHCQMTGSSPLVMPGFPLRTSHSAHTPHYSPYSPSRYVNITFVRKCYSYRNSQFANINVFDD